MKYTNERKMVVVSEVENGKYTRNTIVGYTLDSIGRKLWCACTPSMTLCRVTKSVARDITIASRAGAWCGARTLNEICA